MRRALILFIASAALAMAQPADIIIRNARIWTGDPKRPFAQSMAISDDIIQALDVDPNLKAPKVIDAKGRVILPGFVDSHVHAITGGFNLNSVQLRTARTKQEFIDRLKRYAASQKEGAWILGGDWDHEAWGGELPTRAWIDAVTPKNPVWINRLDGHMGLANSAALKLAGVTARTRELPGGTIVKDATGEPTGILKDSAMQFVTDVLPNRSAEDRRAALIAASNYLASNGVTSIHNMGEMDDIGLFRDVSGSGALKVRVYAGVPLAMARTMQKFIDQSENRGDRWVRWGLMKAFADGSLGSSTAAFEKPYADNPDNLGLILTLPEQLYDLIMVNYLNGQQVAIHAIGDRANKTVLDVFDRIAKIAGPGNQRSRIEHAQHLRAEDIDRFARSGIIASMQPYHLADDGRWAEKRIGPERAKTTYAFRSLLDAKARLAFGSDWPVAPANPMEGIWAAVTRQTLDGKHPNGWVPEQKITLEEALTAYTYGGSYAGYEETYKGRLAPTYLADFVVLDRDIFKTPPAQIRDIKIVMTWVGGKLVYEASAK